jgi:hypothetical protein
MKVSDLFENKRNANDRNHLLGSRDKTDSSPGRTTRPVKISERNFKEVWLALNNSIVQSLPEKIREDQWFPKDAGRLANNWEKNIPKVDLTIALGLRHPDSKSALEKAIAKIKAKGGAMGFALSDLEITVSGPKSGMAMSGLKNGPHTKEDGMFIVHVTGTLVKPGRLR